MSLNCEETFRRFQDYIDRELSEEEMRLVREHLESCGMCAEEYLFEDRVLRHIRKFLADNEVPADLSERVFGALDRDSGV